MMGVWELLTQMHHTKGQASDPSLPAFLPTCVGPEDDGHGEDGAEEHVDAL
jgi:hypothetical protein